MTSRHTQGQWVNYKPQKRSTIIILCYHTVISWEYYRRHLSYYLTSYESWTPLLYVTHVLLLLMYGIIIRSYNTTYTNSNWIIAFWPRDYFSFINKSANLNFLLSLIQTMSHCYDRDKMSQEWTQASVCFKMQKSFHSIFLPPTWFSLVKISSNN